MRRCAFPKLEIIGAFPPVEEALDLNRGYFAQLRHSKDKASWYASMALNEVLVRGKRPLTDRARTEACFPFDRYVLLFPFSGFQQNLWVKFRICFGNAGRRVPLPLDPRTAETTCFMG